MIPIPAQRLYRYALSFTVDGTTIPDPAAYAVTDADLDTAAERDMTGLLHRDMVASKVSLEITYKAIDIDMATKIMALIKKTEFQFTFFDTTSGEVRTITAYSNNRRCTPVWLPEGQPHSGWYADLQFPVIEY